MSNKIILVIILVFSVIWGCSRDKDFSSESALLNTWAQSIKTKDYTLYKKFEAFPKNQDQFNEMYRDYYPSDIAIIEVKESDEIKKDASGRDFSQKDILITGNMITRKDNRANLFKGNIYLVKYSGSSNWLVSGRIFFRSE